MKFFARDYGVIPETDCTKPLLHFLEAMAQTNGEKALVFEKGTYYINRADCKRIYRAITNTTAAEEYADKEDVNQHYVPFIFENINDLTVYGNDSVFVIDGKVTNIVISDCRNICIKNISIRTVHPNVHKLTVVKQSLFSAEFKLSNISRYDKDKDGFYWYGNGYRLGFLENKNSAFWTGTIKPNNKNKITRTSHPFSEAKDIKELAPYTFRVTYPLFHKPFMIGQTFYVFNAHRSDVGIFMEKSKNIMLDGIQQSFNYSLAVVAQDCENITIKNSVFAPEKGSEMEVASLADFIQICMCSGKIDINNNLFDGACDDALNVHGIHFAVDEIDGKKMIVSFRHPQSWGFNPIHPGDKIEFINPDTMLSVSENKIISSNMKDDYHIILEAEREIPKNFAKYVIEDIDRCPSLSFKNNTLNRIITRGILYTSRGKCEIENNHFISNTMSAVLLSDDAKSWYESGMCKDVTIKNNVFEYSGGTPILIYPENLIHKGAVHSNITIADNKLKKYKGVPIVAKSVDNLMVNNNICCKSKKLKVINCTNVST